MSMIPYTYLIGWSAINKYYYGAQYGKNANPKNLWTTYFTSSKYVKQIINFYGDPDVIQIRQTFNTSDECKTWEHRVLRRVIKSPKFLNISCNFGNKANCNSGYVTVKDANNITMLVSTADPRYVSGELISIHKGKVVVKDSDGNKFSVSLTDPRYLSGELVSINKGNSPPNQLGKIWITDGIKNKLISPSLMDLYAPQGFSLGKLQQYPNREYASEINSQLGTIWIFHPLIGPKKIKSNLYSEYFDQGWTRGRK